MATVRTAGRSVSTVSIQLKATVLVRNTKVNEGGPSILWRGITSPFTQELPSCSNCQRIMKKSWPFSAPTAKTRSLKRSSLSPLTSLWTILLRKQTSTVSVHTWRSKKSSFTVVLVCQVNGRKLHPWSFSRQRLCQKKIFRLVSSSRITQRVGWASGWEKFTSRDLMTFSTNLHHYWSATSCVPISPILSKPKWSKLIWCLPPKNSNC